MAPYMASKHSRKFSFKFTYSAARTPAQLMEAQAAIFAEMLTNPDSMISSGDAMSGMPFRPSVDGTIVPTAVDTALRAGASAGVPLLTGTNADEWKLFDMMDATSMDDAELTKRFGALAPDMKSTRDFEKCCSDSISIHVLKT